MRPIYYEIHVSVANATPQAFQQGCARVGVKPVVLALQKREGASLQDMMTSSVVQGDDATAFVEMERIAQALQAQGFEVVRRKMEVVPWHPLAPSEENGLAFGAGQYFESHLEVRIVHEEAATRLRTLAREAQAHLSKNAFKELEDGTYTQMLTLRHYTGTRESFERARDQLAGLLRAEAFEVGKVVTEFALFDSNVHHDHEWVS